MSAVIYSLVKSVVKTGLYGYHKKIHISGLEHIPKDKPVMFLPNHQSALIDVLLIATDCNRKPYFLTRSDVFNGKLLKRIFFYFQMLPIYRMRDGRDTLSNNDTIFNTCAEILNRGEALLLFPEANHNLKRNVRSLSKGFTRILFRAFEMYPDLDVQLIPVGFNYKHAAHFPDEVALCYGKPISARSLFDENDLNTSVITIKNAVSTSLENLTTHIPSNKDYDVVLNKLKVEKVDFLKPAAVNEKIKMLTQQGVDSSFESVSETQGFNMFKWIFTLLNFPIVLIWKLWLKSKVPEDEFMGTFRFAFAMISYPIYMALSFVVIAIFFTPYIGVISICILTLINFWLVKYALR